MVSANYTTAAVSSFNQVISLHPNNSVEHWTSHRKMHFLRFSIGIRVSASLSSTTISLTETALSSHSREIQKMLFAP